MDRRVVEMAMGGGAASVLLLESLGRYIARWDCRGVILGYDAQAWEMSK
jgi:hypothetical protein